MNFSLKIYNLYEIDLHEELFVDCPKIIKDKSSEGRVQTLDARLIMAITVVPRREGWNPRLGGSTRQSMKSSSLLVPKILRRGSTTKSPQEPTLKSALRSLQMRLTRRVSRLIISHVTPASTSPMGPAWSALLIFSPFMLVLFLSSRLPGVPSNRYGVTVTLNVDRDDARVNYRHKKLEQSSVQQI